LQVLPVLVWPSDDQGVNSTNGAFVGAQMKKDQKQASSGYSHQKAA